MIEKKLGSAPRDIQLNTEGRLLAVFMACLAIGGLFLGTFLYRRSGTEAALHERASRDTLTAPGLIDMIGNPEDKESRQRVYFHFTAGGASYHGRTLVQHSDAVLFEAGQRVPIDYLGSDPNYSWIGGHPPQVTPIWLGPFVASTMMIGIVAFAYQIRRDSRLLVEGRVAEGVVVKISTRFEGELAHRRRRVKYEFADMTGRKWPGSFGRTRSLPAIGSAVTVVYDKDNPKRNARYPMHLVKVRDSY